MTSTTIQIRPFNGSDLPALVELWNSTMWADAISEQRLLRDFILDAHFDADGLLLAWDGDDLVGFALGMTPRADRPSDNAVGTGTVVGFGVAESHRRRGIGTELLQRLEDHLRGKGVTAIHIGPWIPAYLGPGVDEAAYIGTVEFLQTLGYEPGAQPVSMRALLDDARGELPSAPDGIEVRPAVSTDAVEAITFARKHFPHWESYVREAMHAVVSEQADATLHVALDGDTIIGFAMTRGERFGPFGVDSNYRGRGIGAVLLSRALAAMREANIKLAYFLWTSDQTARLYQRHGFEIVRRFTMMSKRI